MMTPAQVLELLDTNREILATNKEILATNKKILEEVNEVKRVTRELTEARILKRTLDAERQKKKRTADREKALEGKLETPSNIWKRDGRLHENGTYKRWACIGMRMAMQGRTNSFLRYIMWDWNNNIFLAKPFTKTNGGLHKYMGKGTCRMSTTVTNVFGNERSFNPCTAGEAEIFEFGAFHMCGVLRAMERMPRFGELPRDFLQCIQFICGGFADETDTGALKIRGHTWDVADAPELFPKVAEFRSLYNRTTQALRRGLMSRADQFYAYCVEHGLDTIITQGLADSEVLQQLDRDLKRHDDRERCKNDFLKKLKAQQKSNEMAQAKQIIGNFVAAAHEEKQIQQAIEMSLAPTPEPEEEPERRLGGNDDEKTDV